MVGLGWDVILESDKVDGIRIEKIETQLESRGFYDRHLLSLRMYLRNGKDQ